MKKIMYIAALLSMMCVSVSGASSYLSTSYTVSPTSITAGGSAEVIVQFTDTSALYDIDELKVTLGSRVPGISVTSYDEVTVGTLLSASSTSAAFTVRTASNIAPGSYSLEARGSYDIAAVTYSFKINIPLTVTVRPNLEINTEEIEMVPGALEDVILTIGNKGAGDVRNAVVTITPSDNYIYPVEGGSKVIQLIESGKEGELSFKLRASDVAETGIHPVTVSVEYSDENSVTQSFSTDLGVVVVDAGTEIVVDSIESLLQPGITNSVKIGIKNVGTTELENLYLSLESEDSEDVLRISGANEEVIESLRIGETKSVEFFFDVDSDADARPVDATLDITYQRSGSKKQISESKELGIAINGYVDLRIIDVSVDLQDFEVEVDIANYGNKNAEAVKIELLQGGDIKGTEFTDSLKPDKHKVFRFELPSESAAVLRASYKDFAADGGMSTVEEEIYINLEGLNQGDGGAGIIFFVIIVAIVGFYFYRRKTKKKPKIDLSKLGS